MMEPSGVRAPYDYSCPICGESLDEYIEWDPVDLHIEAGSAHQWGVCTCSCGATVTFKDVYKVTKTIVEDVEEEE